MSSELSFFGTTIPFDSDLIRYNELRLKYESHALESSKIFTEKYKKKLKSLDDIHNYADDIAGELIYECIQKHVINDVLELGVFDVTVEQLLEMYIENNYCVWEDAFTEIDERYLEIVLEKQQMEEYRRNRKAGRGKWIGGGFGLGSAIKGALQAGAINMATGAAHSLVNGIGGIGTSIKASSQKDKIYHDINTFASLKDGLYNSILNFHYLIIEIANQHGIDSIKICISDEDENNSNSILENLKRYEVDEDKRISLLRQAIYSNPYNEEAYIYALDVLGDTNGEIEKIANIFGRDLAGYKLKIVGEKLKKLDLSTEQKALEARKYVLKVAEEYGLEDAGEYLNHVDAALEKFDIQARTVEKVVYSTRNQANEIRQMKDRIENSLKSKNPNEMLQLKCEVIDKFLGDEVLIPYIGKIDKIFTNNLTVEFNKISFNDELSVAQSKDNIFKLIDFYKLGEDNEKVRSIYKAFNEFDTKRLTVGNHLFNTKEEADIARKELMSIEALFKNHERMNIYELLNLRIALNKNNYITVIKEDFENLVNSKIINMINNELKGFDIRTKEGAMAYRERLNRFTDCDIPNFNVYMDRINEQITKLDIEERTFENVLYKTKEEADIARREKIELDGLLKNYINMDESSLLELRNRIVNGDFKVLPTEAYIKMIDDRLNTINSLNRTVDGVLHDTLDEAKAAKEEMANLKIDRNSIIKLNKKQLTELVEKIKNENYKTKLSQIYYNEAIALLSAMNSKESSGFKRALRHQRRINYGLIKIIISISLNLMSMLFLLSSSLIIEEKVLPFVVLVLSVIGLIAYAVELISCAISWSKYKKLPGYEMYFKKNKLKGKLLLISILIFITTLVLMVVTSSTSNVK